MIRVVVALLLLGVTMWGILALFFERRIVDMRNI